MAPPTHEVTQLLLAWGDGDRTALDRLLPLVYRNCAVWRALPAGERRGHTCKRRVINEEYLCCCSTRQCKIAGIFLDVEAQMMRKSWGHARRVTT